MLSYVGVALCSCVYYRGRPERGNTPRLKREVPPPNGREKTKKNRDNWINLLTTVAETGAGWSGLERAAETEEKGLLI